MILFPCHAESIPHLFESDFLPLYATLTNDNFLTIARDVTHTARVNTGTKEAERVLWTTLVIAVCQNIFESKTMSREK